ncbi:WhiB family transcriptional regulator [Streptomyces sp. IBSNAI002]|uniref:WhiB family transcriptional regulator n=1 Tax=Streptomyces sp. IBSNAI002 TaxID=3457500 RepID=UPI003FD1871A
MTSTATAWMAAGLCAQTDPGEFFPEKGASPATAKRLCRACRVREQCLNFAVTNGEQHGVWGGTTVRERARLTERTRGGAS